MSETSDTELIAEAEARVNANRIGLSWARETDKDLIVITRLADALETAEALIGRVYSAIAAANWLSAGESLANIRAAITIYDQEQES